MRKTSYETRCIVSILIALMIGFSMLAGALVYQTHVEHQDAIQPIGIP